MIWTKNSYHSFIEELKNKGEDNYRTFSKKIINTKYPMLGVRTPILRKYVTLIAKKDILTYLEVSESNFYEEVMLEGLLLGKLQDKEMVKKYLLRFLPKIDNWALCDMTVSSLKIVSKEKEFFWPLINQFLQAEALYTRRLGLVLLLNYYVEDQFLENIFSSILSTEGEEYYLDMAKAWLLCECFITNNKKTYIFLKNKDISYSILTKTVQKICDSYRVSSTWKEKVRELRQKRKELL